MRMLSQNWVSLGIVVRRHPIGLVSINCTPRNWKPKATWTAAHIFGPARRGGDLGGLDGWEK